MKTISFLLLIIIIIIPILTSCKVSSQKSERLQKDTLVFNLDEEYLELSDIPGVVLAGGQNPGKLGEVLRDMKGTKGITVDDDGGNSPSKSNDCN